MKLIPISGLTRLGITRADGRALHRRSLWEIAKQFPPDCVTRVRSRLFLIEERVIAYLEQGGNLKRKRTK